MAAAPTSETLTLGLPRKHHPALIGKGGAVIKAWQTDNKDCTLIIPRAEANEDLIRVQCPKGRHDHVIASLERLLGGFKLGPAPLAELKFELPSNRVGTLLGKGGATIKALQTSHGVVIDVPRAPEGAELTTVVVIGCDTAVDAAREAIQTTLGITIQKGGAHDVKDAAASNTVDLQKVKNEVLFFPEDAESKFKRLLQLIYSAKKSVHVCIFTFTSDELCRALLDAHLRKLDVKIVCDDEKTTDKGADIGELKAAGVPVRMDKGAALMHHKFCILDGFLLLNGSFNWTRAAVMENRENILITSAPDLVKPYVDEFAHLWNIYERNATYPNLKALMSAAKK